MSVTKLSAEFAVLGSGFGGSLIAAVLAQQGHDVVVIDPRRHPRFAIGESSTPLADMMLLRLARQYDLPELQSLCQYGIWKQAHPELLCGPKTGFSYFSHVPDRRFTTGPDNANQLLVAASDSREHSDTQWLREDVDHFVVQLAESRGARVLHETQATPSRSSAGWNLSCHQGTRRIRVEAGFVIDASGPAGIMPAADDVEDTTQLLTTRSGAVFAHFSHVTPWEQILRDCGADCGVHPFAAGDAAVHHVLDDGWMWQLRFDDGTLSAGFVSGGAIEPNALTAWTTRLRRFPDLAKQFRAARIVRPAAGLQRVARLQRLRDRGFGDRWVALPSTIGFIDPLHSTGIAHTLFGIARVVELLLHERTSDSDLRRYSDSIISELRLIDRLVSGCYAALNAGEGETDPKAAFELWCHWCMLYFAAATTTERILFRTVSDEAGATEDSQGIGFLLSGDQKFRYLVRCARNWLDRAIVSGDSDRFGEQLRTAIAPWNHAGLCDPTVGNMYRYTAAPRVV